MQHGACPVCCFTGLADVGVVSQRFRLIRRGCAGRALSSMPRSRWKYRRPGGRHCLPHALILRHDPQPAVPVRGGVSAPCTPSRPCSASAGVGRPDHRASLGRWIWTALPCGHGSWPPTVRYSGSASPGSTSTSGRSRPATRPTSTCSAPRREQVLRIWPARLVSPHPAQSPCGACRPPGPA
jgi:hypothetical protein